MTFPAVGNNDPGRGSAIEKAQEWLSGGLAIIDLETTGLGPRDEPIELAVIDGSGNTLLENFLRPTIPIPHEATDIHGISDEEVREAPTIVELLPDLKQLSDLHWLSYNYEFDSQLLRQGFAARGYRRPPWSGSLDDHCIMRLFHTYYYGSQHYPAPWVGLDAAMEQCGLKRTGRKHRALPDALAARDVLLYVANQYSSRRGT